MAIRGAGSWESKNAGIRTFGIAALCFLAFAIALGTLTPALNAVNNVEDSPENPWIALELANNQISYVLPSGIVLGAMADSDAELMVTTELKVDWTAPRSSSKVDMAKLGSVGAPVMLDQGFDLNAGGEMNSSGDVGADYAASLCPPSRECFGVTNAGGVYAGTSRTGSTLGPVSDAVSDHRIWNHGRFQWIDPGQDQVCSPSRELCPSTVGVANTPEPSGVALLGIGLIALAIGSRKRLLA